MSEHIAWYRFQATGAWALVGERQRSLENLRRLVDGGWEGEAEWLEGYWALASLINDPEFGGLRRAERAARND
ncbi:hypothetical protein LAC81_20495 [Ensifer adhaerens]|uniref:hypothetical protein n=1 Tax=Ensifer adhaerens TaxID=106592 RepID=UPI001CC17E55|nr:hypothetical protein [Ensifer adhaerens]MBZ7925818.1 hypothetical protein [Ensifer adhaerens]UAX95016.1 hypothetical protein LAC78_29295 [Ensifer adhaerens]UAY03093.1 hypothetical protein LAC80_31010 [Ensifer adhaerens]UAY11078.1 hypothetical protein LAC81_20495 [Ensifer adhaerens]